MDSTPVTPRDAALCVGAVIISNSRVLLGRRTPHRSTYPNCWDIFGGHVEANEKIEAALRRETMEELGLTVTGWRPLAVVHDPVEPADIHLFLITGWDGTPGNVAPHEHTEIRWFPIEDLPKDPGLRAYREVVAEALRQAT